MYNICKVSIHPGFYVLAFFLELISLFFFSQLLIKALSHIIYYLTKSRDTAIYTLAFLFLPGTIIHELAHVLVAGVSMVHVGEIEFMPEIREDGVKLGSAQIGQSDIFRRALIGVAPVIVGTGLLIGLLWYFTSQIFIDNSFWILKTLPVLLGVFILSNTMFSSKKDLEGTIEVLILIICTFLALYLLGFNQPFVFMEEVLYAGVGDLFKQASLFLLIPIVVDLTVYAFSSAFLRKRY